MITSKISLRQRENGWWEAAPWGKMAPIVEPVPGNTRPARAAESKTPEEAVADLERRWGQPIEVMRINWKYPPEDRAERELFER